MACPAESEDMKFELWMAITAESVDPPLVTNDVTNWLGYVESLELG